MVWAGERPGETTDPRPAQPDRGGWARQVAIVAALIGALCALAVPFLPVRMDAATVSWPQNEAARSIEAPLVSYAPIGLTAEIPCAAISQLAGTGGVVASTIPRQSADMERYGFVLKVVADTPERPGRVDAVSRNTLLWSAPLAEVRDQACALSIDVSTTRSEIAVTGAGPAGAVVERDVRPQVVGVFSDLAGAAPEGMRVDVEVDSRYATSPTPLKLVVIVLAVLAALVSLVALYRLDRTDGRSSRRFLPSRWWRLKPVDWVVFATLLVWHFIGANTSDDGYILGMARGAQSSGYMSNYYRWFSVDEAPFYTPYTDVIGWMTHVSVASTWVRLPVLLSALVCWWVISREVLPRLGAAVRGSKIAVWTTALVFLAFWLPYNNGLRAEFVVATGVILTWVSVERAIATRRLLPAALAILIAAMTLTAAPSGVICVAALIAGARAMTAVIVHRAKTVGYLAQLLPLLAVGVVVLPVIFADRTFTAFTEMLYVHDRIGPGESWFFEYLRYQYLIQPSGDGWLTRRFGVFLMFLCLLVCVVTMLRRGGHIPGTAAGPSRRIIGITFGAMLLMMFAPTKWNHQFGVFAGLAACAAALTAVAVSAKVMRPVRNRALFAAAVFFTLAMSFVAANGYWYVSSWGIPWWDKPPSVAGFGISTFLMGLTVLALAVAAWFHIRPAADPAPDSVTGRFARVPVLMIVAAAMVVFEVASFAKAAVSQYPAYSLAKSNLAATFSGGCGLADDVLVEPNPNASMLRPLSGDPAAALSGTESAGFTPNGVAPVLVSEEVETSTGRANTVSSDPDEIRDAQASAGSTSETSTGSGVNGSSVPLPFGLEPATTPVLGTYSPADQGPAALTTGWYQLPEVVDGSRGDIIAIAVAGRIRSVDADGVERPGQRLELEYGTTQPDGSVAPRGMVMPLDIGPAPVWRNVRVPLDQLPGDADVVRLVAEDKDLGGDQWLAVTPPRVPQTTTINQLLGSQTPVLLDWSVGLNFPCQNHLPTRYGVSELPQYRILPDRGGAAITNMWQAHDGGGPLGWTQLLFTARTLPAYLNHDWDKDWGSIEQYIPIDPDAEAARVSVEQVRRSGTWTPGHIITSF
ncbi:arabinosyltransferase [Nocardia cyriacigeorgica]|uniref:arabinosyltransferase domain-containing protein n=1 Tax=Nocardia cyriacigeorgica TaxID=135487 RepID=UPI0013BE551A|nr:arabinosyltransferase domain-containing protein [Nocardia cyriacigeorgica]NEW51913.1 arabinosyltransferase [Nocardia cyriacigeorgica]